MLLGLSLLRVTGTAAALPVGTWNSTISGVPNSKLPDAPSLGNGYAGVVVADGPFDSLPVPGSVDLWINTNANWGCSNNTATGIPGRLTPAVCSMVGFGGVSFAVPALLKGKDIGSFQAEQRIADGHLYTQQAGASGKVETLTYMHPERNVIVTNITWTGAAPAVLEVRAWVYNSTTQAHDSHDHLGGPTKSQRSPGAMAVTRDATGGSGDQAIRRMRTSLAVALPEGAKPLPSLPFGSRTVVGSSIPLPSGTTVSVVMALEDNLLQTNSYDSAPAAMSLAKGTSAGAVAEAAAAFWSSFWGRSAISLPSEGRIQDYWYGAQYGTATMTASAALLEKTKGLLPPSGLYGPWVTTDHPSWNGDFTLDYNQEAQYYGVFSSNHEEQAAAYFPPITEWMGAARLSAQAHAKKGGITCPANALHYSCHLAPWGYQSHDQSEYMHWNGNFGSLLFINHWEYTQNKTFAKEFAYPLLEGLNAWWGCFLRKVPRAGAPDGYVYTDDSSSDPDNEHENQKVPNPQIGLALIRRSLSAQLSIAKAIGVTPEPLVADMLAHLVPFNIGPNDAPPPPPPPGPPPDCSNCTGASAKFELLPGEACSSDYHDGSMGGCTASHKSAECCAAMCANDHSCQAFTFCEGPGANCPHTACWFYHSGHKCSARQGNFTSGRKKATPSLSLRDKGGGSDIWTAFENGTVKQSDAFALYPLWPSETMNGILASPTDIAIASASVSYYTSQGGIGQRPVLEFSAAVRAGSTRRGAATSMAVVAATASGGPGGCDPTDPATIVHALKHFLGSAQRQSFMPSAPGGGTENVGITQAVNDMLVQAPDGEFIALFPVWDKSQDASFRALLVKGAVEVSATWSAVAKAEIGVSFVARAEHVGPVVVLCTPTLCGGGATPEPKVKAQCEGALAAVKVATLSNGLFGLSFAALPGKKCSLVASSTVTAPTASAPTLKLPTVLASNMVIQRANKPGRQSSLWGWANSSSSVTVTLDGKLLGQAVPNASDGRWTFALPVDAHKEASAGPHTIEVSAGAGATETLTNVAIGDVFFCSGQSNMEYSVNKAFNASAEIADSVNYPDLRFVTFAENAAHAPVTIEPWSIPVSKAPYVWGVSKPANFMPPTGKIQSYPCAVCYFFGRDLYKALGGKVPIGLVQATRGGTKVESFMSPEAIADKTCGGSVPEPGIEPEIGSGSDLWYGMILPLTPLKLSGQLWYQGEANDLGKHPPFVGPKNYQVAGASLLKHTAWATAADLGDGVAGGPDGPCPVPGHPRRKQEVGRRLSLAALNVSYGMDVSWMGPVIETASAVRRPSVLVDGSEIEVTLTMSEPVHEHGQADCVACCESGVATSPIMLSAPTTAAAADVSGRSSNCDELNKVCPRMEGLQAACLACANAHAKELAKDAGCTSGLISDWCNKSHAPRSSKCSTELNKDCPGLKGKNATCFACTAAHEGALTKADCPQSLLKDWCAAPPKSTTGVRTVVIVDGATVTAHATLTAEQLPPNATHVGLLFEFENFGQCALYGGGPTDGPEPHGVYSGTGIVSRERRLLLPLKTVVTHKTNVSGGDAQD